MSCLSYFRSHIKDCHLLVGGALCGFSDGVEVDSADLVGVIICGKALFAVMMDRTKDTLIPVDSWENDTRWTFGDCVRGFTSIESSPSIEGFSCGKMCLADSVKILHRRLKIPITLNGAKSVHIYQNHGLCLQEAGWI